MSAPSLRLIDGATGEMVEGDQNALMARIEDLEKDLENAERDLRSKRALITKLQREKDRERQVYSQRSVVEELFEYWQAKCNRQRSKLTPDRFDAIRNALEWKYTVQQIRLAIDGAAYDPFITRRKNGTECRHNDLELILRDGKHIESNACKAPR